MKTKTMHTTSKTYTIVKKDLEPIVHDHEIWIDPAGGVHHGDEGDPAAMYA